MESWAISGGNGFLGVHLARRLLRAGGAVRSLDLTPVDEPGVERIVGDVRRHGDCLALCRGADVLVHAAAALPIRGAEIRDVNVGGTATALAAASEAGVRRVVFISSSVVYGIQDEPPATEETPPAPIECYGRSKLEAERVCRAFGDRGLEVVVLRPQAFIGPGRLGVFGILFDWIREGRRIYVLGRGANRYQLLAVADLVEAILLAAERPVAGETFNLGAASFGTVAEDLEALIDHAGSSSRIVRVPAAPARTALAGLAAVGLSPLSAWHYRTADRECFVAVEKAERELGWRPQRSNHDALVEAYDSYAASGRQAGGTTHRVPWNEKALTLLRKAS